MPALGSPLVSRINEAAAIPPNQVHDGMLQLLAMPPGPARDVALGSVLTGLLLRGPRLDEVEAAIRAGLSLDRPDQRQLPPPAGKRIVGYTGSGKKGFKTFNISTSAALVAAVGGARIAKLGSHSASSATGSRDFMHHIGAGCDRVPVDEMVAITIDLGFGFFPIENQIPKFNSRYGGRFRAVHALSLALPALVSPVACHAYVYGLSHPAVRHSALLLGRFGLSDACVVSSRLPGGHVDELVPGGEVRVSRRVNGKWDTELARQVDAATRSPIDPAGVAQRISPKSNVNRALEVLAGQETTNARETVIANAALLMLVGQAVSTLPRGLSRARQIVESGSALDLLVAFVRATGGPTAAIRSLLLDSSDADPGRTRVDAADEGGTPCWLVPS